MKFLHFIFLAQLVFICFSLPAKDFHSKSKDSSKQDGFVV